MLRDEPLDSIYDPEDDAIDGQPPIEIERAVKFSRFGAIEYIEYEQSKGFMLRGLTLQTRHDINYELQTFGRPAFFLRNIYVERGIQEMMIMYPNRVSQYTKKDFYAEEKEFSVTTSAKFNSKFNFFAMPVTNEVTRRSTLTFIKWARANDRSGGFLDTIGLKVVDCQKSGVLREEAAVEWSQKDNWKFQTKKQY